jgi:hypothetical protein
MAHICGNRATTVGRLFVRSKDSGGFEITMLRGAEPQGQGEYDSDEIA